MFDIAKPRAVPNIFCSAIPILKNRSGNAFANLKVLVEKDRSASRTTILSCNPILGSSTAPPLICLSDFNGDSRAYIEHLFSVFKKDFIDSKPFFSKKQIWHDNKITVQNKPEGFWHLTTEKDKMTGERSITDLRRCERLCWIRPIIENCTDKCIDKWDLLENKRKKVRIKIFLRDYDFLVILDTLKNNYFLVTSYYLNWPHSKRKIIKERDRYIKQKSP